MGISRISSANAQGLSLKVANTTVTADATNVVTVGNKYVTAVTYANGGAIDALSADAWTDVQDINLGRPFVFAIRNGSNGTLHINMAGETAGDYVRAQWELDGVAVLDITVGPSKAQSGTCLNTDTAYTSTTPPIFANSRFRVRLYKHGTIDQAGSNISVEEIYYTEVNT